MFLKYIFPYVLQYCIGQLFVVVVYSIIPHASKIFLIFLHFFSKSNIGQMFMKTRSRVLVCSKKSKSIAWQYVIKSSLPLISISLSICNCSRTSQTVRLSLMNFTPEILPNTPFTWTLYFPIFPMQLVPLSCHVSLEFLNTFLNCLRPKHWVSIWSPILHFSSQRNVLRPLEWSSLTLTTFPLWNPIGAIQGNEIAYLWIMQINRLIPKAWWLEMHNMYRHLYSQTSSMSPESWYILWVKMVKSIQTAVLLGQVLRSKN